MVLLLPYYYYYYVFDTWKYFCWSQKWFYLFYICLIVGTNKTKLKYTFFLSVFRQYSSFFLLSNEMF